MKVFLFATICTVVLAVTGYLIWSTVSINIASVTRGPVHFHADFEIWNCGNKIDLVDPEGWDNKVGTPLLHEHNDDRIHVEGPVLSYSDITLGKFFEVVGGLPLPNVAECNGYSAVTQVFVYKTVGETFSQQKILDWPNYVLSPHSSVPPGDCIIVELDMEKEKTDKMCTFYKIAIQKGELSER